MECMVLSWVSITQLLPRSQNIVQTVINQHTLQLSSFQLRSTSCSESGCCCPGQSQHSEQRLGAESGRTNDRDEQERTETWNQVGSFLLNSRSFKLIWSQTTHHYWPVLSRCHTQLHLVFPVLVWRWYEHTPLFIPPCPQINNHGKSQNTTSY